MPEGMRYAEDPLSGDPLSGDPLSGDPLSGQRFVGSAQRPARTRPFS
ncbi:hypothetical protein HEB94_003621 [Actinopolymorpha pittospori]|uniref:Uncharacterized protein n=1 Tax=Actinopolymorpha pittospori TaxID=648752 RepID=A0A927MWW3_9ACTN|nr:hypothetical protein [Actinopolymorpha pittospori]